MDTIKWFKAHAKTLLKSIDSDPDAQRRVAAVLRDEASPSLQKLQHVVAVEAGFLNWKALIDASDAERHLAIVMTEEPLLHAWGVGTSPDDWRKPRDEKWAIIARDRHMLRGRVEDVAWTVEWLKSNITPIKTINHRRSSYGLKHIAEKHSPQRYLTNGTFIAAVMIAGYPIKFFADCYNPKFGMSEKSIKALLR